MKTRLVMTLSGVVLSALGVSALAFDKIAVDKLPAAVTKAIKDKFPNGKIEGAETEVEDGKTIYEVEVDSKGGEYTVSLKADGTIEEIEKELAEGDLPAAVAATLKAEFPNGKFKEIEEATKGDKVTYELQVVENGKKTLEVTVDPQGKILSKKEVAEEAKEKDEKAEKKD